MKTKKRKFFSFKILCLIGYICCVVVLIFESCMDGNASANQSNALGGSIAGIVNDIGGDKSVIVKPTKINIKNKIDSAIVDETYQLDVEILPIDTTNKSIIYQSSNDDIASISPSGLISFNKNGIVTFSVISAEDNTLIDTMEVNINHIEVEDILISTDANVIDDIYHLYLDEIYTLEVSYEPANATLKDMSITTDNNMYLTISADGVITPLNYSNGTITTLTIKIGSKEKMLKFIVDIKNLINLESIIPEKTSYDIYVTERKKLSFSFYPENATFKEYEITSNDPSVCTISSGSIQGKNVGTTTITITSKMDNTISTTLIVNVLPQPNVEKFSVSNSTINMYTSSVTKIQISIISPTQYANKNSLTYSSNNDEVISLSNDGTIKALKEGNATITISNHDNSCVKTVTVNVIDYIPPVDVEEDTTTTGMDIAFKKTAYYYTNTTYNLNDLIKVTKYYNKDNDDNYLPKNQQLSFEINKTTTSGEVNIAKPGYYNVTVTHVASGISRDITICFFDQLDIYINDQKLTNNAENINLMANESFNITINNPSSTYQIETSNIDYGTLNETSTNHYEFSAFNTEGVVTIKIIPYYYTLPINSRAISINVNVYHIKTTKLEISAFDNNLDKELQIKDNNLSIYLNDSITINTKIDQDVTLSNITFISSNPSIIGIDQNGNIITNHYGKATITIKDEVSTITKSINIVVKNIIKLNQEKPITINGGTLSWENNQRICTIYKGKASSINLKFTSDTTYTIATYHSSNEGVVSVGSDGRLNPHKEGDSQITIKINDGYSGEIVITINIKVRPLLTINDIGQFLHKIRKGIGHFGAFLFFGICSSLTFLLFFKHKHWFFSIPICFVQGFGIAALTEYIQTFVPGRNGTTSDVLLDFTGFCFSSIIISLSFILVVVIKYIKEKIKLNSNID